MVQTFATLPIEVEEAITKSLSQEKSSIWISKAQELHERYFSREKEKNSYFLKDRDDALAYLALRTPATYAQIFSALLSVKEVLPEFSPQSVLDIGTGPGTALWAATSIWTSVTSVTGVDTNNDLLILAGNIASTIPGFPNCVWKNHDVTHGLNEVNNFYDVVIIANVLNELTEQQKEKVVEQAFAQCTGVLIIVEPGTEFGNAIIQHVGHEYATKGKVIAPYMNGSFVESFAYWLHFPQRFIRPEFLRRIRQSMRDSYLMASDWESAKYSYVAISKLPSQTDFWGRCVGPVKKEKGFVTVPILTREGIIDSKVLKRFKSQYTFARNLKWGEIIPNKEDLLFEK